MVRSANQVGVATIINLTFSESPKHTDAYYVERARQAADLRPARICIKDPGALLTPDRTRTLVPAVLAAVGDIPIEFHTHCITGLGPMCCYEAIKRGVRSINTAIPPLANGSSNPSLFTIARNARALGYSTAIDESVLKRVEDHFNIIAKREGFALGEPREYDSYHYHHQVPGGMISNFRFQLDKLGMGHRVGEVLEETARVRQELGYPIMVTPYSQFVGVQAAMNVILGERYKECTDEMIHYALGTWGAEESDSIDADIKDKILNRSRARELKQCRAPEPTLQQFRAKLDGTGLTDDELLLRYFAGKDDVEEMKAAGPVREYPSVQQPLILLIQGLSKQKSLRHVVVQRGDLAVRLERHDTVGNS